MLLLHRGFDLCYKGSYGRFKRASGERGGKGMAMAEKAGVSGTMLGAVAGGAAMVAAVLGWQLWPREPAVPQPVPVAAPVAPPPAAPAAVPAAPAPAPQPAAARPVPPRFDTFRLGEDGTAIVAGIGTGGTAVAVLIDGAEAAQAAIDGAGRFAAIFALDPAPQPRMMTLRLTLADGGTLESEESVVIAPVLQLAAVDPAPGEGAAEPAPAETAAAAPAADAGSATPAPAPAAGGEPPAAVAAGGAAEPAAAEAAGPSAEAPAGGPAPAPPAAGDAASAQAPAAEASGVPEATAAEPPAAVPQAPAQQPPVAVQAAGPAAAPAAPLPATPGAPGPQTPAAAEPAPVAAAPTPQPQPEATPAQPASLLVSGEGVRVLRPAADAKLAIDAISYSDEGAVRVSGKGGAGSFIRLYLDNAPQLDTLVDEAGAWHGTLPPVDPGLYTLRADQLDAGGKVEARSETPFLREAPEALAAAARTPAADGQTAQLVTVQPGYTLWGIARQRYGRGIEYVKVFEANRTQIRNPHLIYPGQVFSLPEAE